MAPTIIATAAPEPPDEPEPPAEPEPTEEAEPPLARRRLVRCERVVGAHAPGLVAGAGPARVHIATPAGDDVASVPADPPVGWSPSGRLLATGPHGDLWRADGTPFTARETQRAFVSNRRLSWAWSPAADCALALDADGVLYVIDADTRGAPQSYAEIAVERGAESFAWSPDGRRFAVVVDRGAARRILVARLPRPRWLEVKRFYPRVCCVTLGGWSPDGRHLLYWAGPGVSAMADGWPLRSVSGAGVHLWGSTLPTPGAITECGDRLVGLVGGDRHQQGNQIAVLRPARRPEVLSGRSTYRGPSCSATGEYIAVSRDGRLEVIRSDGAPVIDPGPDDLLTELAPEWGPPGTGVLVVRQAHVFRQLWFLPEGGSESGYTTTLYPGSAPLRSLFDWSATPPTDLPLEPP